jgi:hypothetical protein
MIDTIGIWIIGIGATTLASLLLWLFITGRQLAKEMAELNEKVALLRPEVQQRAKNACQQILEFLCAEEGIPLVYVNEPYISGNGKEAVGTYTCRNQGCPL